MKSGKVVSVSSNKPNESKHTKPDTSFLTDTTNEEKIESEKEKLESLSLESMKYCSRFEICSAQKCPLDVLISKRYSDPDEPKCEMPKVTRHKYWESMPDSIKSELKFEGYLESEFNRMRSARERWLGLPESKKAEITARLMHLR